MTSGPQTGTRAGQPYVGIPIEATLREWGEVNALVEEVREWLAREGIPPAGPPMYRYRVVGDTDRKFSVEVAWPVATAVAGDGRVTAGSVPAGRYAIFVHTGHPDRLPESHALLQDWLTARGLARGSHQEGADTTWGGWFETFLTNPADEPDPEKWSVEIAWLLEDAAGDAPASG